MNAKNNEIKKALTKAVKDARKEYAKKNLAALVEKLIAQEENSRKSRIEWAKKHEAEIVKIDSDKDYLVLTDPKRIELWRDRDGYRRYVRNHAQQDVERLPEDLARIDAKIERLRTDAKHAENEAFKIAFLEARMNAAQSKKNTFTLQRAWYGDRGSKTEPNGIADAAADTMEAWFKAAGIEYRRMLDDKREGYGTIQYVRFTWAD